MNLKEIKEIVEVMNRNELAEFVIEREGFRLSLKKEPARREGMVISQAPMVQQVPATVQPPVVEAASEQGETKEDRYEYVISPMVGTFYNAPSPDSPPFVSEGQEVNKETVVCIIEAMKVMNEIKAEKKGIIAEILVENGEAVEYGTRLIKLARS